VITCTGPAYTPPEVTASTFWEHLLSLGREWMWNSFNFKEDDTLSWLITALMNDTLIWVTDGSYDSKLAPEISGVGLVVFDSESTQSWECSFVEYLPDANSYAHISGRCDSTL
jgi:hypothetical protein